MMNIDPNGCAELVESIHQPWRATVGECLRRWRALDMPIRERSYLIVQEGSDRQYTLNARKIAVLAARLG